MQLSCVFEKNCRNFYVLRGLRAIPCELLKKLRKRGVPLNHLVDQKHCDEKTLISGTIQHKNNELHSNYPQISQKNNEGHIVLYWKKGFQNKPGKVPSLKFFQGYVNMSLSSVPRGKYHLPTFGLLDSLCIEGCKQGKNAKE